MDPDTKICNGCKKQYFKIPKLSAQRIWNVASVLLLTAAASLCLYTYSNWKYNYGQAIALQTELQQTQAQLKETLDEVSEWKDYAYQYREKWRAADKRNESRYVIDLETGAIRPQ